MLAESVAEDIAAEPIDINKRRYRALMIMGIAMPFLLYPFLSLLFIPSATDYITRMYLSRFLIWITVGILALYARYGEMQDFFLWPERNYKTSFYFKAIAGVYLLGFAAGIIAKIPYWLGFHENNAVLIKALNAMYKSPFLIFFSAITAGFTEEFVFRGYILSRLSLFFNNKHTAIIISALLFAFIHLSYKTVNELIFVFLIGLITGYHYQKYRNITVLVVVHFLIDVVAFLLYKPGHKY